MPIPALARATRATNPPDAVPLLKLTGGEPRPAVEMLLLFPAAGYYRHRAWPVPRADSPRPEGCPPEAIWVPERQVYVTYTWESPPPDDGR